MRWNPLPALETEVDLIDGVVTYAGNGNPAAGAGVAAHLYAANRPMRRFFYNADGEMLFVPHAGRVTFLTEMGMMSVRPGEVAVIPRGVRFRAELPDGEARGYICENYGAAFRLPELGPIGSNGLANPRDFLSPAAWFEDVAGPCEVIAKFQGGLWTMTQGHSPLDVVAWHGNLAPYKYDTAHFNVIGTISFDHPDPSIYTVLTSPTDTPGVANCDFVVFAPRWLVAEHTFRPPWFHRNIMSEFMGLVHGVYDAKAGGFLPGGASLHNCMSPHGPDKLSYDGAIASDLKPHKLDNTLAFMFESRWVYRPTRYACETTALQQDYDSCWNGFVKASPPTR
jgi:homogentisate 1,2-dioxygenase